jgi:hypothetical protein
MQVAIVNGQARAFSWTTGWVAKREETLLEQARKSPEELRRVCLWLQNHGRHDEALALRERFA